MMRDWGGYRTILEEAKTLEAVDRVKPLLDCPKCGDLLALNYRGIRSCPMGHFRTDSTTYGALYTVGS